MRLCVFCGSNSGGRADYTAAAAAFGRVLARNGHTLVYGGARVGLMGALADAALEAEGRVVGVIPEALVDKEIAHDRLSELRIVGSMHARKAMMAEIADGFVALPGGVGTLEELFEMWTWAQLGYHDKPCGMLDVAGYFARLAAFLDHQVEEGFVRPAHRDMLIVASDPTELLDRFARYEAPRVEKWIAPGET